MSWGKRAFSDSLLGKYCTLKYSKETKEIQGENQKPGGSRFFSALQVLFCTKKQDLKIRQCSDKSTYLRETKELLGCGIKFPH